VAKKHGPKPKSARIQTVRTWPKLKAQPRGPKYSGPISPLPDLSKLQQEVLDVTRVRPAPCTQLVVITPAHASGVRFLVEAYRSLQAQTLKDWAWIVLLNNGAVLPPTSPLRQDARVRIVQAPSELKTIGALKAAAIAESGDEPFIVELDCDDLLALRALELVLKTFVEGADFVYSDGAEFYLDAATGNVKSQREGIYPFGAAYGWSNYPVSAGANPLGVELIAMAAAPVTPHTMRLVDWAPNHVRAWRRSVYESVGGHNLTMQGADDHDLMVRMYLAGVQFVRIPVCLYYQRIHATNSQTVLNTAVRTETWNVYDRNIYALIDKFCADNQLLKVDLCSGPVGPQHKDMQAWDKLHGHELEGRWPAEDNSVGVIRANDGVEHLRDPIHTMNEAYRVLAPGGFFVISVPSTDGRGAWCDPTHVSFWNHLSFRYYCEPRFMHYVPVFTGHFQCAKLITWFPSEWHANNNVPYVEAHLIKRVKDDGLYGANMQEMR